MSFNSNRWKERETFCDSRTTLCGYRVYESRPTAHLISREWTQHRNKLTHTQSCNHPPPTPSPKCSTTALVAMTSSLHASIVFIQAELNFAIYHEFYHFGLVISSAACGILVSLRVFCWVHDTPPSGVSSNWTGAFFLGNICNELDMDMSKSNALNDKGRIMEHARLVRHQSFRMTCYLPRF